MVTPYGPVCDRCRSPLINPAYVSFFHTQERYCSLPCLEEAEEQWREVYRLKEAAYTVTRGWIDTAGKTRTWILLNYNNERVAEVTTKRDAERLARLLKGRR